TANSAIPKNWPMDMTACRSRRCTSSASTRPTCGCSAPASHSATTCSSTCTSTGWKRSPHMTSAHAHGHDHQHDVTQHDPEAAERKKLAFDGKRIYAIGDLLIEKGILRGEDIQAQIDYMDTRSPANGARLVARAWVDPVFKQRLLTDPRAACAEMGIDASGLVEFVVLENTATVHNLVVCTLCSCYPRPILGRPPDWYKSFAYRSRAVVEPRGVMREFGTELPPDVE